MDDEQVPAVERDRDDLKLTATLVGRDVEQLPVVHDRSGPRRLASDDGDLLVIHVMPHHSQEEEPMINPEDYRVTPETVDGGDVDLDAEAVLGLDGRRITEADTQAFTTARGGRPSLTGAGTRSPRVSFRVPELILQRAEQRAEVEQVSLSVLARRALERYLDDVAAS